MIFLLVGSTVPRAARTKYGLSDFGYFLPLSTLPIPLARFRLFYTARHAPNMYCPIPVIFCSAYAPNTECPISVIFAVQLASDTNYSFG